jgi:RNA polymerase sigma-70 factor (ECF subfamily)
VNSAPLPLSDSAEAADPRPRASASPALIARAAAGDRTAQAKLIEEYYDFVRYMLFRLCGPGPDFEDLRQTVLVELLQSLPRFRGEAALTTFIARICVNVFRNHLRRARSRPLAPPPDDSADPVDPLHRLESRQALGGCVRVLDTLSPNHRLVFVLRNMLGYSIDEIAELMGSARSTTRLRLYYARKAFARALAEDETGKPARVNA